MSSLKVIISINFLQLEENNSKQRVEIDQKAARKQIAGIINENMRRLDEFDSQDREDVNEDDLQIDFGF